MVNRLWQLCCWFGILAGSALAGAVGFTSLPGATTGLWFTNAIAPARYLTNQIPLNGSGVALGDFDGDGRIDIFLAGLEGGSALFRNLGEWRFERITATAFPGGLKFDATGCVAVDLDGDGHLDLIVNTLGEGTRVFHNDGLAHFRETARLNPGRAGMSLTLADVDGDGDLDLYVVNYRLSSIRDDPGATFRIRDEGGRQRVVAYNGRNTSEPDLIGRFFLGPAGVKENGEPDVLYLNDGKGGLAPVDWTGGAFLDATGKVLTTAPYDWGLSAVLRDFNGDGRPDLYVCNDFETPDRFWLNETPPGGPLRFRAVGSPAVRHFSAFSMGVDVADLDRDGQDDFLVLDMLSRSHRRRNLQVAGLPPNVGSPGALDFLPQFSHNTVFRHRGDGTFAEIGRLAGLSASEWSWSPVFLDVDLDGYEDLLVSNGHELEMMDADLSDQVEREKARRKMSPRELLEMRLKFHRFDAPNAAFRNRGDFTFEDVSHAWGFDVASVAHGLAAADLDGDGDLDVVANCLNGPALLYRNEATARRLRVRLKSAAPNTRAIGARISVQVGDGLVQSQQLVAGGRYLSGDAAERTFAVSPSWLAAGKKDPAVVVEVRWPSGRVTRHENPASGPLLELTEPAVAAPPRLAAPPPVVAHFSDVTAALGGHVHHDEVFDDFSRQPSLPRSLAYLGPGVTWADVDGDGVDDLLVGGGTGGRVAVWRGDGTGKFTPLTNAVLARPLARDLTTLLYFNRTLLAGSANYEDGGTNGGAIRIVDLDRNVSGELVLHPPFSVGPVALADVDGKGSLEVFLGGRAIPGRYPEPAGSVLLQINGGRLTPRQNFPALGLVSGACFTDLDGDGRPELALATEWGPLKILRQREGQLQPWDPLVVLPGAEGSPRPLSALTGWWNSIVAGDFDGDGRMDLAAGNWGRNHFFAGEASRRPLRIRGGDLNGDGLPDPLVSFRDVDGREVPTRKWDGLVAAFPALRDAFPTREAFGAADIEQITGTAGRAPILGEAAWFDSVVLLNRGDRFELRPLPLEAQVSPVFGLVVADFDGDGREDLFLAQNFTANDPEEMRHDAGRSVWLRGDGRGGFTAVPGEQSGLQIYGDGRGAATADFDRDGRPDLVVGQNSAATRLYRNAGAKPGLRVRLNGPEQNPRGCGAILRLTYADGTQGPARELHSGAGYWSVDSAVTVLALPQAARELHVQWPGGGTNAYALPPGAREIVVSPKGVVESR